MLDVQVFGVVFRVPVTTLQYFVTRSSGMMVQPGMLRDVSTTVSVAAHPLYLGAVWRYEEQYSFVVHGEVASDIITGQVFTTLEPVWRAQISGASCK